MSIHEKIDKKIDEKVDKVVAWYNNSKHFKGAVEATVNTVNHAHDKIDGVIEKNKIFNFCNKSWEIFETSKDFYDALQEMGEKCSIGAQIGSGLGAMGGPIGGIIGGIIGGTIGGVVGLRKVIKIYRELKDKTKQAEIALDASNILHKTDLASMNKKSVTESMGRMFARVGVCNPSEAKAVLAAVNYANDYAVGKGFKKPPQNLFNNPVFKNAFTTLVNYRRLDNEGYETASSNLKAAYSSTIAAKCANSTELLGKISDALLNAKESTEHHLQALSECLLGSGNEQIVVEAIHTSIESLEIAEMNVKASINSIEDYVKNNFSC